MAHCPHCVFSPFFSRGDIDRRAFQRAPPPSATGVREAPPKMVLFKKYFCARKFEAWGSRPRPGGRATPLTLAHHHKPFGSARIARGLHGLDLVGACPRLVALDPRWQRQQGSRLGRNDRHARPARAKRSRKKKFTRAGTVNRAALSRRFSVDQDLNLVLGPKWSPGPGIDIYHPKAVDHHMQPGLLTPIVSDVGRRH